LKEDHNKALSDIINFFLVFPEDDPEQYSAYFKSIFHDIDLLLAEQYYSEIIKIVSQDCFIYWFASLALADCFNLQGFYKKSISAYSRIIKQVGNVSLFLLLAYSGRADVYFHLDEYDKALHDYAAIIESYPIIKENYSLEGKDFYKKLPFDSDPISAHERRANIYYFKSMNEKEESRILEINKMAIDEYSEAIQRSEETRCEQCYLERARLYVKINKLNDAIKDYTKIIKMAEKTKVSTSFLEAYKERIEIFIKKGKYLKAFLELLKKSKVKESSFDYLTNAFVKDKEKNKYIILEE